MRLIYVDDEVGAVKKFEEMASGIQEVESVVSFIDGEAALEFLRNNSVDIAFTGIAMNHLDGILLAQQMEEINPDLHIVFITAHSSYALQAFEVNADGYILKPYDKEDLEKQVCKIQKKFHIQKKGRVYFQTIPHFELFVDGRLVPITQKRVKELLAILVDYAGSSVTSEQAINYMWEDRLIDDNSKALLRMTARRLRDLLAQEKIEDILIEENGVRALDIKKVECDYFQILQGNKEVMKRYHGEYMVEYSWAEDTNAKIAQITGSMIGEPI